MFMTRVPRRVPRSRSVAALLLLLAAALVPGLLAGPAGCGDDVTLCDEACESDDECGYGLLCFPVEEGPRCLPKECGACFYGTATTARCQILWSGDPKFPNCEFNRCGF